MQDFQDKVAVITGGASGVGRSLAFALGRRGARVMIADVDQDALQTVTTELAAEDIRASHEFCDVSSAESCAALAEKSRAAFGAVHLVFANAGIGAGEAGAMWEYSVKDWQWSFDVNVWGVIHCINAFMPLLVEQNEEARFIITGSGNGAFIVLQDAPIYTASKAAVQAITENLFHQVEALEAPIRVHALFPGPHIVETGIFNSDRVRPEHLKKEGTEQDSGIQSVEDMKKMAAEYDIELEFTHPDEVAARAVKGIEKGDFWLMELTEEHEQKIRERADMILGRKTPIAHRSGD